MAALPFLVFPLAFGKGGVLESALLGASTLAVCATTLAFPFVPPGFALPWASFAGFFFGEGLTLPNALDLVAPGAARFVLPAIVLVAVCFFLEGKRAALAFCFGAAACTALGILLSRQSLSSFSLSPSPACLRRRRLLREARGARRRDRSDRRRAAAPPRPAGARARAAAAVLAAPGHPASLTPPRPRV